MVHESDIVKRGEDEPLRFYGSDADLKALCEILTAAGFEQFHDTAIHASSSVPREKSVAFLIVNGFGARIKAFLTMRGKRLVTREAHGEKLVIKGDFSAEEIERILKAAFSLKIEDDNEPPANPNRESEMGYHVGLKKPSQK